MQRHIIRAALGKRIVNAIAACWRHHRITVYVGKVLTATEGIVAQSLYTGGQTYLHKHGAVAETFTAYIAQSGRQLQRSKIYAAHKLLGLERVDAQLQIERCHEHITHKGRKSVCFFKATHGVIKTPTTHRGRYGHLSAVVGGLPTRYGHLGIIAITFIYSVICDTIAAKPLRQCWQVVNKMAETAPFVAALKHLCKPLLHMHRYGTGIRHIAKRSCGHTIGRR